jgi:hypothetical protein
MPRPERSRRWFAARAGKARLGVLFMIEITGALGVIASIQTQLNGHDCLPRQLRPAALDHGLLPSAVIF